MKLSYTYATTETAAKNILALRGDPGEAFAFLASCGYHGVELMVRDVSKLDPSQLLRAARSNGIAICAVSTGQLRAEDGLNLSDVDENNRRATVSRCFEVIDFASVLGVQINIGSLRGMLPPERREEAIEKARESFDDVFAYASKQGVAVAIEPQHRYMINWLNNVPQTIQWIKSFDAHNARIVFDVYHWMVEERDIIESLVLSRDLISHVQFSDSQRGIPGSGHLNFPEIMKVLSAMEYKGFISVEASQHPDSRTVAKASAVYLLDLLSKVQNMDIPRLNKSLSLQTK